MSTPISLPKQYVGFLLNVSFYVDTLTRRLGDLAVHVHMGETVRQMLHMYFYAENLPSMFPTDTYLGATVVYRTNQNTLPDSVRGAILTVMADSQWDLHDYINTSIQYPLTRSVPNEREYYYTVDGSNGRLMVYVPVTPEMVPGVHTLPEAAIVYSCFNTLPMDKRMAYAPALAKLTVQPPVANF